MSNEYGSRSSRHERRSSRWAKKDSDVVEAAANQAIKHLEETEDQTAERTSRQKLTHGKTLRIPLATYGLLTGLSILLALSFYAFPLWKPVATASQSQNLYSGFAMHHGLVPYNDFYGTGGSIFYLINWLGNTGGSTWLLWLFEIIALLISGILTYHLVSQQTRNHTASLTVSVFTLVIIAGLARGGDSPTLFALPFALWGAQFLSQYFQDSSTDRGFIRFGMAAAFALVISPVMSIFFILSALALVIYNISIRRIGHGFYQMLASILGVLLVGYSVAYYSLEAQTVYTSIEQSVLIPFTHFGPSGDLLVTLAKALVLTLIFGIVAGFVQGLVQLKKGGPARIWYVMLLIGIVGVTTIVVFAQTFDSSNLLAVLPFTVVFAGLSLKDSDQILLKYLQNRLFAPILAILFVIFTPISYHFMNRTIASEEQNVAQYIQDNAKSSDRVYVVSDGKNINNLTNTISTLDNVPANYPVKFTQNYDLKVGKLTDKYVVLQAAQEVPASLKKVLDKDYKVSNYSGKYFQVYQKK